MEAVASSGESTRTHAAPIGYACTPKKAQSLIYKHSIIILFFQGAQRKAYKYMLMLAAGIEPAKPEQAKKGADCTPLKS